MIHIKYSIFKNEQNLDSNEIQVSNHKENTFKTIYQIINQKIIKKQTINLEQLVIFCSFKIIKKLKIKRIMKKRKKNQMNNF